MNTPVPRPLGRAGFTMLKMGAAAVVSALYALTATAAPKPNLAAAPPARAQTAGMGTLSIGQSQFYPQGCMHNGNRAICNFLLVFTGLQATAPAWNGATAQIQFIDNAHVPHKADAGYFIDSFGAHQPALMLQRGDPVWITFEFPDVDPAVTYGEFHWETRLSARSPSSNPTTWRREPSMPRAPHPRRSRRQAPRPCRRRAHPPRCPS